MPAQEKVKAQRVLELNAEHPVFEKLRSLYPHDKDRLKTYAELLYDQALLIEGIAIEDPGGLLPEALRNHVTENSGKKETDELRYPASL